jgi:DNA-binding SARP family transcriptional activator
MDFRLLGSLEVRHGDRLLPLGGAKQRSVLAVLLLHANQVVSIDTLLDLVWGERPPPSGTAYLHNCISRLRKELGPDVLETRSPGYVLHASVQEVDARRFERALVAARPLEPVERAAALVEALLLWRGPPLADFTFERFAAAEVARLEELRLVALEERLEAELELGRHTELVPELEALVARHPSRERLRRAQMLALYRSRRKPDALRAYQDARLALIEELGLEPSEELRALERSIHADDPALERVVPAEPVERVLEVRRSVVVVYVEPEGEEQADPEAADRSTAAWLAAIEPAIDRHGGLIRRLAADEMVAFFGLPAAHEDDGLRALRAAVEIRAALANVGAPGRIALAAGPVVAHDAQPPTGSAVREAHRLKDRAAPGTILLSPSVLRLVGHAVDTVPADGIGGAFRLLRLEPDKPAIVRRFDLPLVGRERELAGLESAFVETVEQGRSRRIAVLGEAGIGKSRLVRELVSSLEARALIVTGRCVAYGEAARYLPLAEVLRQVIGRTEPRREIERLLPGDGTEVADALVSLVEDMRPTAPTPNIFHGVRRLLEALARKQPVVVVLEDAHWADPMVLDLVEQLVDRSGDAPILLLCVSRPELLDARPDWARDATVLGPLEDSDARIILRDQAPDAAPDRSAEIVTRAEGNPLFLEQLLAFGVEGAGALPPTIEALLASRLDRLTRAERELLGHAAVVGREFWRSAAEALAAPDDESAVAGRLIALAQRRFIQPAASSFAGEEGFEFHHALIRDAAYDSLPKVQRARLHGQLATWLGGRPDAADEVVAFHLEQAHAYSREQGLEAPELAREAGERYGRAGILAWKRNDPRAADDLLTRAVRLLPSDDGERLALACELATALKAIGDYNRVEEVLSETIRVAARRGLRRIEQRARVELVWPLLLHGRADLEESIRFVEATLAEEADEGDARLLERAWFCLAALRGRLQSRHAASGEAALNALRYTRRTGFSRVGSLTMLAADARDGPRSVVDAIGSCKGLLADAGADKGAEASVVLALASLQAMRGDFDGGREQIERARSLLSEFGYHSALTRDWLLAATEVELLAGNPGSVEGVLRAACSELARAGDTAWLATQTAALGEIVYELDRTDEALELSAAAMVTASHGDLPAGVAWRLVRAKALARAGRAGEGEPLVQEALALLEPTDALNARAKAYLALAEVRRYEGQADAEASALAEARALLTTKGNEALLRRIAS